MHVFVNDNKNQYFYMYLYVGGGKPTPTQGSSIEPPSWTTRVLSKDPCVDNPLEDGKFSIRIGIFPAWDMSCTVNLQKIEI